MKEQYTVPPKSRPVTYHDEFLYYAKKIPFGLYRYSIEETPIVEVVSLASQLSNGQHKWFVVTQVPKQNKDYWKHVKRIGRAEGIKTTTLSTLISVEEFLKEYILEDGRTNRFVWINSNVKENQ